MQSFIEFIAWWDCSHVTFKDDFRLLGYLRPPAFPVSIHLAIFVAGKFKMTAASAFRKPLPLLAYVISKYLTE